MCRDLGPFMDEEIRLNQNSRLIDRKKNATEGQIERICSLVNVYGLGHTLNWGVYSKLFGCERGNLKREQKDFSCECL